MAGIKLPIEKTVFGLLHEQKGRKDRVKNYINQLPLDYPSTQARINQFWNDNQGEFYGLKDNSPYTNWLSFFNKFNLEADLLNLINPQAQNNIKTLMVVAVGDSPTIQELKKITWEQNHKDNLPLYFDDLTGGVCWVNFLMETLKQYYLNDLPTYIDNKLKENPPIVLTELDSEK